MNLKKIIKNDSINLDKILANKTYIEEKDVLKSKIQYMLNNGIIVPLTYKYKSSRKSKSFFVIYRGNNKEMCIEMISLLHFKINKKLDKLKYKILKYDKVYIVYIFVILKKRERIIERESWFISYDSGYIEPNGTYSFTRKGYKGKDFFLRNFDDYKKLENEEDDAEGNLKGIKRDKVRRLFCIYTNLVNPKDKDKFLTREIIEENIKRIFGENLLRYAISREKYKDGRYNYHVMVILKEKIIVRTNGKFDEKIFDIKVSENIYHPNILKFNDKSQKIVVNYLLKEDENAFINMDMMKWMIKQDSDKFVYLEYLIRKFTILGLSDKEIEKKLVEIHYSLCGKSRKISDIIKKYKKKLKKKIKK